MEEKTLPFSALWPLLGGALVGITLRLVFSGNKAGAYEAMMASFIYLVPVIVGMVTVYIAETRARRTWAYYIWAPSIANTLFVVGTLLIMIEGWICAIIILPLFAVLGSLGGLIMGLISRTTGWPKQTLYSVAILPLILGGVEANVPLPEQINSIERTIIINATPSQVWYQIHNARDIKPEEVNFAWAYRIGVPVPISGVSQQTPAGIVRKISMGKGIHFDQIVAEWKQNQYVRWTYRFDQDSFPPRALDEHVRIGGQYFDFKDTSYTLRPCAQGTELTLRMQYRVSTQFNWYADSAARILLGNVEEALLSYYRRRSEHSAASG